MELVGGLFPSYNTPGLKLKTILIQRIDEVSNGVLRS